MIFETAKYTAQLDEKGAIVSLVSNGKQFAKKRLPLFVLQLRNGADIEKISSDDAKNIELIKENNVVKCKYEFDNLSFCVTLTFDDRIESTFSFENHTLKYVEWVDLCQFAIPNDLVANGGSGKLVMDINEGLLLEDIKLKEQFYPYRKLR